jgi:hypothetical protein
MPKKPQHLKALARANKIRFARADIRKQVFNGEITIAGLVTTMPKAIETLEVYKALTWQMRWGRARSLRALQTIGLSEWVTFGNLTPRQKDLLIKKFI